ncbi:aminotransferase class I/II-fold pyridoxal phosphate-dependent enzyme [Granulicella sp. 5B5]|uniref:pyridoxal phosphate-dependent aminotransferase n=1 Tax=Granulicella sp. 5B5 TaxID=1617967 RepID=UPI0015F45B0A|nr:pyridoxal phosphate-dependent aminotransferase [Granulicella sp. 5B5]QMV17485.1 aminotransferase class I/II-fold pyridoxal phosphate-dependent enzyme [Granulicella sp. 5B5]
MNFSTRTSWNLAENDFAKATRMAREAGRGLLDLTASNPTSCGFSLLPGFLDELARSDAATYMPDPFGMLSARAAVAAYYSDLGVNVPYEHIALTTSTSEAYSYLFRLLCNAGDEILVAQTSYPLFDFIANLDDVCLKHYPLHYDPNADEDHSWAIDLDMLVANITSRTRAIVLVHPNNPTGHYVSLKERAALYQLCSAHNLALIVDEVFLDYSLSLPQATFAATESPCLTFVLSGLSKVCALPQMKCSWIVTSGPKEIIREALARLEVIADTFLSMNAPIQHALPGWLAGRRPVQRQIIGRMRDNLATLDARLLDTSAHRLALQGGWTVVLRVPRTINDVPFAEAALANDVLVQPGDFYGLPEGRIVLSLLTPPDLWRRGLTCLPIDGE